MIAAMSPRALALALALPFATLTVAALRPGPSSAQPVPSAPSLERVAGSCGELTPGSQPPLLTLSATVRRGVVRVRVRHYVAPCAPPPEFRLEVAPRPDASGSTPITLHALAPTGPSVARCLCTHQLDYAVRGLPAGRFALRVEAGRSRLPSGEPGAAGARYARVALQIP